LQDPETSFLAFGKSRAALDSVRIIAVRHIINKFYVSSMNALANHRIDIASRQLLLYRDRPLDLVAIKAANPLSMLLLIVQSYRA
jgi:hypothetical protein